MIRIKIRHFFRKIIRVVLVFAIIYVIIILLLGVSNLIEDLFKEKQIVSEEDIHKNTAIFQKKELKQDEIVLIDSFIDETMKEFNNHEYDKLLEKMNISYINRFEVNSETIKKFCEDKFNKIKLYNYQLVSLVDNYYVYYIQIYDNMMITGINGFDDYEEETLKIVIIKENDKYKLCLNEYIETVYYNRKINSENFIATLIDKDVYYDKESIKCKIKNVSDDVLIISNDTYNLDVKLVYTTKSHLNSLNSDIDYSLLNSDLIILPDEEKEFNFVFRNKFFDTRGNMVSEKICINNIKFIGQENIDIINNFDELLNGNIEIKDIMNIEIPL